MTIKWLCFALFVALFSAFSGCSVSSETDKPAKKDRDKPSGAINTFAEEVTGYRAVKQGQRMQEKIRRIDAEHDKDLNAIMGTDE